MDTNITEHRVTLESLDMAEFDWICKLLTEDNFDQIVECLGISVEEAPGMGLYLEDIWPIFRYTIRARRQPGHWDVTMFQTHDSQYGGDSSMIVATIIRAFLSKFRPGDIVEMGVARRGSDGFSGEELLITAKGIYNSSNIMDKVYQALHVGKESFVVGAHRITIEPSNT